MNRQEEVAKNICSDIKRLCKTFGKRNAGSEGERQTAEYFENSLQACSDSVVSEKFSVHPNSFMGWVPISITCVLLGIAAYFFSALVSLLFMAVALIPFIGEFILYKRMLDPLFEEKTSQNVTALKKCAQEPKKRLYFVANMDATFENGLKFRLGGVVFILIFVFDLIAVTYFIALSIARWVFVGGVGAGIANGAMLYAGLAGLIFVPAIFTSYFTINHKVVTDGANMNLTGCLVALNALEALKDVELKNTEVGVILTGSGTVGMRGAKAWCDLHANDVNKENTVFISLNSLRELRSLNVNSSEMRGIVKSDKDVVKLVLDSAKNLDIKCSNHRIPFDASDSTPFTQSGFKSAGICAINMSLPDYYCTRYDSYDNLSEECIAASYALVLEIIQNYADEGQLFEKEEAVVAQNSEIVQETQSEQENTQEIQND